MNGLYSFKLGTWTGKAVVILEGEIKTITQFLDILRKHLKIRDYTVY